MITSNRFALCYRVTALLLTISGVLLTVFRPNGQMNLPVFRYYTVQSNLLAVFLFLLLTYQTIKNLPNKQGHASFFPRFELMVVVGLLVTLVIYWVLLAPSAFSMGNGASTLNYRNLSVHLITPLLCLLDYILFVIPGQLRYKDIYKVAIYPLAYVALAIVLAFAGQTYGVHEADGLPLRYPYFFIDFDRMGAAVFGYLIGLLLFFLLLAHVFYLIDRKRSHKYNSLPN